MIRPTTLETYLSSREHMLCSGCPAVLTVQEIRWTDRGAGPEPLCPSCAKPWLPFPLPAREGGAPCRTP